MKRDHAEVLQVIYAAVQAVNGQLPKDRQISTVPEAALYGKSGKLDSLGLVNLIVAVEQEIEDRFGIAVTLADESALSQQNSPFRTIDALAQYIGNLLESAA